MSEVTQHSLTSPLDKNETEQKSFKLNQTLSEDEVNEAMKELNVKDFVQKFTKFEKFYADPKLESQVHCLVSFFPSKGATPDSDGVFGMLN